MSETVLNKYLAEMTGLTAGSMQALKEGLTTLMEASKDAGFPLFEKLAAIHNKNFPEHSYYLWKWEPPTKGYIISMGCAVEELENDRAFLSLDLEIAWYADQGQGSESLRLQLEREAGWTLGHQGKAPVSPERPLSIGWLVKEIRPSSPLYRESALPRGEVQRAARLIIHAIKALS